MMVNFGTRAEDMAVIILVKLGNHFLFTQESDHSPLSYIRPAAAARVIRPQAAAHWAVTNYGLGNALLQSLPGPP